MTKLEYTFKTDTMFKTLFTQHPDLLENLVSVLLAIPPQSIQHFEIINTELPSDYVGGKFCRLDINMTVNGQRVNLEVQVARQEHYINRVLFHWARDYSAALPEGGKYKDLPRTVIISIIDFNQFQCAHFHSEFCPLEVTRHEHLTDKMSLHFFELLKLPADELNINNKLLLWLALFKASTEEELEQIKALEEPTMEQAISAYQRISASPEFRELERLRSLSRHDEASALGEAEERGEKRGEERGEKREREKWQGVVADQAAEIEKLRLQMAELQAKNGTGH
ncbi:MAG: Rpn family recombination-promoting nuclease/putative transposase [Treponema sp.]|nr:Rpn family recombination-promoting nuclease/putative transposase [Treponema sp.]